MAVGEARLEQLESGLAPVTDGWFVVNVRDAAWVTNDALGDACIFEGDEVEFPQVGFTIGVLQPGQASRYHREANQENFLVLAGSCLLLVEGEERPLAAWDFVHCPPDTEHAFVATGDAPCVIFMTGARAGWPETGVVYVRSEIALRHSAGVEQDTSSPAEAYAAFPKWLPGRPASWAGLPWDEPPA
jgi:quercetin dioxygenase-like cupin family protein